MSHLVILTGDPFEKGTVLKLSESFLVIGRSSKEGTPDIAFENAFISRKHAVITERKNRYYIEDTGSRHGTRVNGNRLPPFASHKLQHHDDISLCNGFIRLKFVESALEETMEMPAVQVKEDDRPGKGTLDPVKNEWWVEGECIKLTPKEFACLQSLLTSDAPYVSKQQLIQDTWPERTGKVDELPVSSEELNAVLYRLRKKTSPHLLIHNIRRKGYTVE